MEAQGNNLSAKRPRIIARTNQEAIRVKTTYLSELGLWPPLVLDPIGWLQNFDDDDDIIFAAHLLNGFIFYNERLLTEVLRASVESCASLLARASPWRDVIANWDEFMARARWATLQGMADVGTQDGSLAVISRSIFEASGTSVLPGLGAAIRDDVTAIFVVDDYFGDFTDSDPRAHILRALIARSSAPVFLCAAFAQEPAAHRLREAIPGAELLCPHVLPPKYSVNSQDSIVWPELLIPGVPSFLARASDRAGVDPAWVDDTEPAIALAFSYRATAHTVPLFRNCPAPSWRPLLRGQS